MKPNDPINLSQPPISDPPINALCIDADDLGQALMEVGFPVRCLGHGIREESKRLLDALAELNIRGTWFIPGHFFRYAGTSLLRQIAEAGHEVASHGTQHCLVGRMDPQSFLMDIVESRKRLEDTIGQRVDTYKAPAWSIMPSCSWALDCLIEAGFRVDHSAMPPLKWHLGVSTTRLLPFTYKTLTIIPPTTLSLFGLPIPFAGGFYNAHIPTAIQLKLYDTINRKGVPFNVYFHPFEYAPSKNLRSHIQSQRWYMSLYMKFYTAHAGRYETVLRRLSSRYRLAPLKEAYKPWLVGQDVD